MDTQRVTEATRRQLADDARYDNGGVLPLGISTFVNDTGAPIPVIPLRGEVRISRASAEALGTDVLDKLMANNDLVISGD